VERELTLLRAQRADFMHSSKWLYRRTGEAYSALRDVRERIVAGIRWSIIPKWGDRQTCLITCSPLTTMRLHFLVLCLLSCLLVLGCAPSDDGKVVTPRFLLDRGFVRSPADPTHYTLKGVTVAQAADRLGFSMKDLIPGTNNPPDVDIMLVVVRDYEFALVSQPQTNLNLAYEALKKPDTLCTVEARLIPQLRRQKADK